MRTIDNVGKAWRLFSVQLAAVAVAFGSLSAEVQAQILGMVGVPQERLPAILGLLFLVLRLVKQGR